MLRLYHIVGGMPEAVQKYAATRSLTQTQPVHRSLMASYIADINKYRGRLELDGIDTALENLAANTGRQLKYTAVEPDWPIVKTKRLLGLFDRILLTHRVKNSTASGLPLGACALSKAFKLLFLDIGLMQHLCGVPVTGILEARDILDTYRGALAEQFAGQELLCQNPSENERLYYWARQEKNSSAEIDYLIVRNGIIHPVEIKSGSAGKLKSLAIFMQEHPDCGEAYVLSSSNIRIDTDHRIKFLPLYARL